MKKTTWMLLLGAALGMLLAGCAKTAPDPVPSPQSPSPKVYNSVSPAEESYRDGEYTASASLEDTERNHGWQEYVKIKVEGGQVVSAEYDAVQDGKRKSQLSKEDYPMEPHPGVWIPELNAQLRKARVPEDIDGVTGATLSSGMVRKLYGEALAKARQGGVGNGGVKNGGAGASPAPVP